MGERDVVERLGRLGNSTWMSAEGEEVCRDAIAEIRRLRSIPEGAIEGCIPVGRMPVGDVPFRTWVDWELIEGGHMRPATLILRHTTPGGDE